MNKTPDYKKAFETIVDKFDITTMDFDEKYFINDLFSSVKIDKETYEIIKECLEGVDHESNDS